MNPDVGTRGLFARHEQLPQFPRAELPAAKRIALVTYYHKKFHWKIERACAFFGVTEATYFRHREKQETPASKKFTKKLSRARRDKQWYSPHAWG